MLTFRFSGVSGQLVEPDILTSGMVGRQCRMEFTSDWDGLEKTVVFTAGSVTRDVINAGELVEIPADCLAVENVRLHVGVYGVAGDRVTPTIIVPGPYILPGANPSGDESTNPDLPIWAQLWSEIDKLKGGIDADTVREIIADYLSTDADVVGKATTDLENYYLKTEIDRMVDQIPKFSIRVVTTLPTANISDQVIYIIPGGSDGDMYTEYIHVNGAWELIGSQRVDLTGYATEEWVNEALKRYQPAGNYLTKAPVDSVNGRTGAVVIASADIGRPVTVWEYGGKGDGVTDDTDAFLGALAEHREVYVPGGVYKLSAEMVIRDGCRLELAKDAVLNFSQTDGNCITMNRSACLTGNHATVNVPYSFVGHVINVDTTVHESVKDVPPWRHWDPQWKTGRYLTDLDICKADDAGLHRSTNGDSNGTAVYIFANGDATSTFIWGLNFSGLRIAGAFEYGLRAISTGYNHEMRLEAFMDACKIGVSLEDCNNAYISATIQPRAAADGKVYATHGIQLIRSENAELQGSRVWDWNDKTSLWTPDKTNPYQHIAMYGDCKGAIINDFNYFHLPTGFTDLRELIYADTPSNYENLVIVQEPITKWFKPMDGDPYFDGGGNLERLAYKKEMDALFETDYVAQFVDALSTATDDTGAVFNGIGYKQGQAWATDGKTAISNAWSTCTGYIPCKKGDVLYADGMKYSNDGGGEARVILFDVNHNRILHVNQGNIIANASSYYVNNYVETDTGFSVEITRVDAAYIRLVVPTNTLSNHPVISVGTPISYAQEGFLADGIKVKAENVIGLGKLPTDEHINSLINAALGVIVDGKF